MNKSRLGQAHELFAQIPQPLCLLIVAGLIRDFLLKGATARLLAIAPAPVHAGLFVIWIGNDGSDPLSSQLLGDIAPGDVLLEPGEDGAEQGIVITE